MKLSFVLKRILSLIKSLMRIILVKLSPEISFDSFIKVYVFKNEFYIKNKLIVYMRRKNKKQEEIKSIWITTGEIINKKIKIITNNNFNE